ncbi:MAG: hypothetical protein Q4F95_15460 [Oscillospiraceae bacterium]|nr:hypothetical protein [Oscillospiraceae bacterium]
MIKIKLGLVDADPVYLNRITELFTRKYQEQIEVYSFTDAKNIPQIVREKRINVLIASQDIMIDTQQIADFCMFAYFVDYNTIETYNKKRVVCKYQKADLIYKQILGLYSEKLADKVKYKNSSDKKARLLLFVSGCDGAGATTTAAAYATRLALKGKKTLFLNLKQFGSVPFTGGAGDGSFTNAIFAVKSKKVNMTLKLESVVKQSQQGVYFYESCKSSLDYAEMKADELECLLDEMKTNFGYEYIVLVDDFYMCEKFMFLLKYVTGIIMVSDSVRTSQIQLKKRYEAINSVEKRTKTSISDKVGLLLNKTTSRNCFRTDIALVGVQPKLKINSQSELVKVISESDVFDKICAG